MLVNLDGFNHIALNLTGPNFAWRVIFEEIGVKLPDG